ncbi:Cyclic AMP-responsive element-binding protein 5 [Microtus ochrogaster]|uniref:Cyclic AMP-responsive element-binding protein 5 n=1 Tax=Microtus ochrogaster TaxID=79684 RepID=A0A8J6GE05_MICOH|nr:Cyclic AMP-responsive element-binding protein 5 [Microtus ochrogaster]
MQWQQRVRTVNQACHLLVNRESLYSLGIYEESKMNLEQERPFVCSAPGCSQRFPTEDHLMIHRHKHEMTLKFPSIKTDNMLSDQTPTPTRFLKNCEEVGLFSELDCSLEHEFRKAQEEENSKRVGGPGWTLEVWVPSVMWNKSGTAICIEVFLMYNALTQSPREACL